MSDSRQKLAEFDDYFIPNLCRGEGLFGLLLMAALMSLMIALILSGLEHFDFVLLGKIALEVFWITLLSALFLCCARRYLTAPRRPSSADSAFSQPLSLAHIAIINYVLVLLATAICAWLAEVWHGFSTTGDWRADPLTIANTLLIAAIPAGAILRFFYLQHRLRQQQSANLEARFDALQARIRPHFLFNSMNSLASLIRVDADKAEKTVENLCGLFRYALHDTSGGVSLQQEVQACQQYLDIEALRLEERLKSEWIISVDMGKIRVPALILQPLVENAVFHGIQPARDGGYLRVAIGEQDGWVCIEVVNSIDIAAPNTARVVGNNLALTNLRHRLDAFFQGRAELQQQIINSEYRTRILFKPLEG